VYVGGGRLEEIFRFQRFQFSQLLADLALRVLYGAEKLAVGALDGNVLPSAVIAEPSVQAILVEATRIAVEAPW
jgi:hypothetical protein